MAETLGGDNVTAKPPTGVPGGMCKPVSHQGQAISADRNDGETIPARMVKSDSSLSDATLQRCTENRDVNMVKEDTNRTKDEDNPELILSPQHRFVSQSVPRIAPDSPGDRSIDDLDSEPHNESTMTIGRKKKHSIRGFFKKMLRPSKSSTSLNSMAGGTPTRMSFRALSVRSLFKPRSRAGSLSSAQLGGTESQGQLNNASPAKTGKDSAESVPTKVTPVSGIKNHGNTCFMNAVIQCLSHTDCFAEFMVMDKHKLDMKKSKASARKFGTKGEVTDQLSQVMKCLWTSQSATESSFDFLSVVGKYASQYQGFAQHDAQEFLIWLLDKLHEDLNTAVGPRKKKFKLNQNIETASEVIEENKKINRSYVYDIFQAWFQSSLTCPACRKQSYTYDPFLSVSLPIPQKANRAISVTMVILDPSSRPVKVGVCVDQHGRVAELRRAVGQQANVLPEQLILVEIYYDGFHRTFHDENPVSDIRDMDNVYAIEVPVVRPQGTSKEEAYQASSQITLVLLNKTGVGQTSKRFGNPLVLQTERDISYKVLEERVFNNLRDSQVIKQGITRSANLFCFRVVDGLPGGRSYLPSDVDLPLYVPAIDKAQAINLEGSGPNHVKLIVEWDPVTQQRCCVAADDPVPEHTSVRESEARARNPGIATLNDCFYMYTKEEKLGGDDAWDCPSCRRKQQGAIKKLSLYSLPEVMAVHLKRFRQDGSHRNKLDMMVNFPLSGLNMKPYMADSVHGHTTYHLYAVCNHYGNMNGGHYTAFCRHPVSGKWYTFDDTRVLEMVPEEVLTKEAYLLFYQRTDTQSNHGNQGNPAVEGHWSQRIPSFQYSAKLHRSAYNTTTKDDMHAGYQVSPKINNSVYATMRPRRGEGVAPLASPPSTPGSSPRSGGTPSSTPTKPGVTVSAPTSPVHQPLVVNLPHVQGSSKCQQGANKAEMPSTQPKMLTQPATVKLTPEKPLQVKLPEEKRSAAVAHASTSSLPQPAPCSAQHHKQMNGTAGPSTPPSVGVYVPYTATKPPHQAGHTAAKPPKPQKKPVPKELGMHPALLLTNNTGITKAPESTQDPSQTKTGPTAAGTPGNHDNQRKHQGNLTSHQGSPHSNHQHSNQAAHGYHNNHQHSFHSNLAGFPGDHVAGHHGYTRRGVPLWQHRGMVNSMHYQYQTWSYQSRPPASLNGYAINGPSSDASPVARNRTHSNHTPGSPAPRRDPYNPQWGTAQQHSSPQQGPQPGGVEVSPRAPPRSTSLSPSVLRRPAAHQGALNSSACNGVTSPHDVPVSISSRNPPSGPSSTAAAYPSPRAAVAMTAASSLPAAASVAAGKPSPAPKPSGLGQKVSSPRPSLTGPSQAAKHVGTYYPAGHQAHTNSRSHGNGTKVAGLCQETNV